MEIVDKSAQKSKFFSCIFAIPIIMVGAAVGLLIYAQAGQSGLFKKVRQSDRILFPEHAIAHQGDVLSSFVEPLFGASYNGKSFYRLPCDSFDRIKSQNRIYFTSYQEAVEVGYTLSQKCP